ncbi:hypothetical protein SAMN06265373_107179 [Shimia sagamensis]|uniref:Uncharacterized protein n=1 Tax=Shimia sagamensis TaxID=1566352 RepID=A0ABY1PBQ2_9RHOB|nr:hypothetical protein SAMN06265373_107179 [Shimia sagamensis]
MKFPTPGLMFMEIRFGLDRQVGCVLEVWRKKCESLISIKTRRCADAYGEGVRNFPETPYVF